MTRPDSSGRLPSFKPTSGIAKTQQRHQQFACDRCRGQKLRCTRTPNPNNACERCQKAGATCVVDLSVRMGRPQRTDKERRGTASSRKSQPIPSPESPTGRRMSSQAASQNPTTDGSMWLDHGSEDAGDLNLAGAQYLESLDFGLHSGALDNDQMRIAPPEDLFEANFDFVSPQVTRAQSDFGICDNTAVEKPNADAILPASPWPQEAVEKLSGLNMEIHRQLSIVSQLAKEYATTEPSLMDSPDQRTPLSCAVVSMIQGLQTFHELLLEILGAASQNSCKETARRGSQHSSQKNGASVQNTVTWQKTKHCPSSILSLADSDMETVSEFENGERPRSRSDTNSEIRHGQDSPPQIAWLDMPTSLLVMSCYINLIQLCQEVFAAIRGALPVPGHQATLLELSGFQINGVSVHEDSDLQIIILTQVVVRLIDRIGLYLGHPYSSTAQARKRDVNGPCGKAMSPQLLDFVLGQEGMQGQPSCKERIEALREEIRKLSEMVYKPI
ncbi:hypothetical protein B0T10DRAFT_418519 [Thelonectria olida]|uniref:Zn(2)-C6 fungal-type domain-containing protein n=1 Tax=Thelonectria olida TaxID=1576542 RepID=A0A9P9AGZ6_9HYPO|nr:hypothetical protein B0T10DRAFT_418519 [Thelonectria olida]